MPSELLGTQIGAAAACAYSVQLLQKWSKTPWITQHTTGINTAVRIALSGAATIGIGWVWGSTESGGHTLTIAIPATGTLVLGLWHWFIQYAIQHGWGSLLSVQPEQAQEAVEKEIAKP